jgi:hypothetical protein
MLGLSLLMLVLVVPVMVLVLLVRLALLQCRQVLAVEMGAPQRTPVLLVEVPETVATVTNLAA